MSEATDTTRKPELITYLDPTELVPNPRNPRTSLGDLDELTASIRAGGVLEPLIVAPSEVGGYLVLFGTAAVRPPSTPGRRPCRASCGPSTPRRTPSSSSGCWPRTCTGPT